MPNYRDYGAIRGAVAPQIAVNEKKHTQVYLATHDGNGDYLPYMNRSFISFSYGGKNIEDFNLIASIENNSLNRQGYASFSDNVTTSDIYDGQLYWSTHYDSNQISFILVTDGMTEEQLNNFLQWFQPGKEKELILSEHPNRAILARVASTPQLDLLPFEGETKVVIATRELNAKTTLYKGRINLSFTMDEPFWYSIKNILDEENAGEFVYGYWRGANGSEEILSSSDALKIIQEDRIPITSMLSYEGSPAMLLGIERALELDLSGEGAIIGYARVGSARIGYAFKNTNTGLTISQSSDTIIPGYFFYGGNAPCAPKFVFSLTPVIDSNTYFVTSPMNSFTNPTTPYNTITIESSTTQQFKFTTPSIYTAYNQIINILNSVSTGISWEELRNIFREHVKHYAPRAYVMSVIDNLGSLGTVTTTANLNRIKAEMPKFFYKADSGTDATPAPIIFTIDSKLGQATALISYRHSYSANDYLAEIAENVGDMVRSKYLVITDRNAFSQDGYVRYWTEEHPEYSYRIYTDVAGGLSNLTVQYKYLYL